MLAVVLGLIMLFQACDRTNTKETINNTGVTEAIPRETPKTGFEHDLEFVRKGRFTYVWVFARKDGQPLDKDDAAYLRKHAPQVVDWVTTDEGRRVIGGTNFDLEKGNLELLKKRFVVEDYSGK